MHNNCYLRVPNGNARAVFTVLAVFAVLLFLADTAWSKEKDFGLDEQGMALLSDFRKIIRDIESGSDESFRKALDAVSSVKDACDGIDPAEEDFRRVSAEKAREMGLEFVRKTNKCSLSRIIRVMPTDESYWALVRFDYGDAGFGYVDFELAAALDGSLRVVDVLDYSTGLNLVETIRLPALYAIKLPNSFARLYGLSEKQAAEVYALFDFFKGERYEKGIAATRELNEKAASRKEIVAACLENAVRAGQNRSYLQILGDAATRLADDPAMTWLNATYGFLSEDYGRALKYMERFEKMAERGDAFILAMKAEALILLGRYDEGITLARRATEIEPALEEGYWAVFMGYCASGRFDRALAQAKLLEETFNYRMEEESLRKSELFRAFTASREYRQWRDGEER